MSNKQLRTSHLTVTWTHFKTASIIFETCSDFYFSSQ